MTIEIQDILILIKEYLLNIFAFDPNSPLLFTHFRFWAFFAVVFTGFSIVAGSLHKNRSGARLHLPGWRRVLRNGYLFLISLLFYYKTSGLFVGLLILVTLTDFFLARGIYRFRQKAINKGHEKSKMALFLLCLSVTIDLGILCYFKYSYFFADIVNQIFGTNFQVTNIAARLGNHIIGRPFWSVDRIVLPVGISFYTFQVISYTADVYKGLVRPVRNILDFGFYVSFFPQLVAGPIIKASDFIPQLYRRYALSRTQFGIAVFWILNGLTKKIVMSDYLAVNFIDRVFANPQLFSGFENLAALFAYSFQVYADFSGYTDIAIGLSLIMGFYLPQNFNSPYKAQNARNFWKRWHISLSRWLQTYLYIPLGGNRNISFGTWFWICVITIAALILSGSWIVAVIVLAIALATVITALRSPGKRRHIYANMNSMITMLLGGLWHGASCNFMIWGGLNGVGMIIFKFWSDWHTVKRIIVTSYVVCILFLLRLWASPALALWNVLLCFCAFILLSMIIKCIWQYYNSQRDYVRWPRFAKATNVVWSVIVTFTFITFTRLFFRSGSNLDPAVANETAWNIATSMMTRIGTEWTVNPLDVIPAYWKVFLLFCIGMAIHWIPERMKRRYRYSFAKLPLPLMVLVCAFAIFIIYQFVTAEMQPFIYFQF